MNYWNECKRIISALSQYSNEFDIYIKDYPDSSQKDRVIRLLRKLKDEHIIYVSSAGRFTQKCHYKSIIQDANALIYPWVSTSFIEGLYTSADILLYDNSEMTIEANTVLKNCSVFSSDLNVFIKELGDYLDNLSLLSTNNENTNDCNVILKNYFIQSIDNKSRINTIINLQD